MEACNLMTARLDMTIGEIVAADHRAAAVFDRYGLDFCCHGRRTIDEEAREAGIDVSAVLDELDSVLSTPARGGPRFQTLGCPRPDVVHRRQPSRVRARGHPIAARSHRKIADVHGRRHPELEQIARIFEGVAAEMTTHMTREERILFPFIVRLASAVGRDERPPDAPFGMIEHPIRMMEAEHESAGAAMAQIRALTSGYRPPVDACTTYRVCLQELEAFEQDLHEHVHLENNILFPTALRMEEQLTAPAPD